MYNEEEIIAYYLDLALTGYAEQENKYCYTFKVEPEDRKQFPSIPRIKRWFILFIGEKGVYLK